MVGQAGSALPYTQVPLYIDGKDITTERTFDVKHPATGKVVSKVSVAGENET